MSWSVKPKGKRYCVVNNDTGNSVKCYDSIVQAESHKNRLNSTRTGARSKVSAIRKAQGIKYPKRK